MRSEAEVRAELRGCDLKLDQELVTLNKLHKTLASRRILEQQLQVVVGLTARIGVLHWVLEKGDDP